MNELKQVIDTIQGWIDEATKEREQAKECLNGLHEDDDGGRDHFRAEMHYLNGRIDACNDAQHLCLEIMSKPVANGGNE